MLNFQIDWMPGIPEIKEPPGKLRTRFPDGQRSRQPVASGEKVNNIESDNVKMVSCET